MNPQEHEVLRRLRAQLVQIRGVKKNPDTDALIQDAVAQHLDATYLLTQRALTQRAPLLGVALDQAGASATELGAEVQRSGSAYVGSGVVRESRAAPSAGSSLSVAPGVSTSSTARSFLQRSAITAVGVAGGAIPFEGIVAVLDHQGDLFAATFLPTTEEVTVNHYHSGEPGSEHEAPHDRDRGRADFADADDDFA